MVEEGKDSRPEKAAEDSHWQISESLTATQDFCLHLVKGRDVGARRLTPCTQEGCRERRVGTAD